MKLHESLAVEASIRSAIIGYGIAAYTLVVPRVPHVAPGPLPGLSTGAMFAIGVGLQLLIVGGRLLASRYERSHGFADQISPLVTYVLELVADGVTVLLFALGTYAPLLQFIG